jgi:hypothetical protein
VRRFGIRNRIVNERVNIINNKHVLRNMTFAEKTG